MSLVGQLITVGFIVLFLYLFIQNIRFERKKHFFVFHVLALLFLAQAFIKVDTNYLAYDETSVLISILSLDEDEEKVHGELLDVAQFGDLRYGLVQFSDGSLSLAQFEKQGKHFILQNSVINQHKDVRDVNLTNNGFSHSTWTQTFGVNHDSHILEIVLIDQYTREEYKFPVDSEQPGIYNIEVPSKIDLLALKYIYEKGFEQGEE